MSLVLPFLSTMKRSACEMCSFCKCSLCRNHEKQKKNLSLGLIIIMVSSFSFLRYSFLLFSSSQARLSLGFIFILSSSFLSLSPSSFTFYLTAVSMHARQQQRMIILSSIFLSLFFLFIKYLY